MLELMCQSLSISSSMSQRQLRRGHCLLVHVTEWNAEIAGQGRYRGHVHLLSIPILGVHVHGPAVRVAPLFMITSSARPAICDQPHPVSLPEVFFEKPKRRHGRLALSATRRNDNPKRTAEFKAVAQKMAGDDRDLNSINYCFRRVNHGFAFEELKTIAEVFGKYRNKGRGRILSAVQKVKEELTQ